MRNMISGLDICMGLISNYQKLLQAKEIKDLVM